MKAPSRPLSAAEGLATVCLQSAAALQPPSASRATFGNGDKLVERLSSAPRAWRIERINVARRPRISSEDHRLIASASRRGSPPRARNVPALDPSMRWNDARTQPQLLAGAMGN